MLDMKRDHPDWSDDKYLAEGRKVVAYPHGFGSGHQAGAAVDITLCDGAGREFYLGTKIDEFNDKIHTDCPNILPGRAGNGAISCATLCKARAWPIIPTNGGILAMATGCGRKSLGAPRLSSRRSIDNIMQKMHHIIEKENGLCGADISYNVNNALIRLSNAEIKSSCASRSFAAGLRPSAGFRLIPRVRRWII